MYPYTIILTSWEVFNLSLFIQKINVSSRKIPYILKIMRGPICHNIRTIWDYFSLSKFSFTNFNKLQHTEVYQLSGFFSIFHLSCITLSLNEIRNSRQEKLAYHTMTPCTTFTPSPQLFCCFTNHALKKGPITPSR